MVSVLRFTVAGFGLCFVLGFAACTNGSSSTPDETAGTGNASGNAGASGGGDMDGSAGGNDAADAGVIEQVDASTSCSDLFTLARNQLDEATTCTVDAGTSECTGLVDATCGCRVSVNSATSAATQSYSNTLAVIQAKNCGGACPPLFCEPPGPGACVPRAGTTGGVCVHHP